MIIVLQAYYADHAYYSDADLSFLLYLPITFLCLQSNTRLDWKIYLMPGTSLKVYSKMKQEI